MVCLYSEEWLDAKPCLCSSSCYKSKCDFLSYHVKCKQPVSTCLHTDISFNQLRRILAVCEMRAFFAAVLVMAVFLTVTDAYNPLVCYQDHTGCTGDYFVSFTNGWSKCCDLLLHVPCCWYRLCALVLQFILMHAKYRSCMSPYVCGERERKRERERLINSLFYQFSDYHLYVII